MTARTADFDFCLPPDLIAQHPANPRDSARLLVVGDELADRHVCDLPDLLRPGDLLVANDTRVIPAQLAAHRGGARIGITLDRPAGQGAWYALARNARRLREGDTLRFEGATDFSATIAAVHPGGSVTLAFSHDGADFSARLARAGALALPPYIERPAGPTNKDASDYQTIFARREGAVAAPTAGLHFTPALLDALASRGIVRTNVTLHVGAGTFLPVRTEDLEQHHMHAERGEITAESAETINKTRRAGGRIVCIGTTSLRLLESSVDASGEVHPFVGETNIFLRPGATIRAANLLLTNFHLPRSTLFMLVCAFAGTARMKQAYAHAIAAKYRFYSYRRRNLAVPGMTFSWQPIAADGAARAGVLRTAHGDVETPVFMPVGTAGTVKAMTADAVRATGASIVLANTYHLMLRPGAERVASLGGLHRFMDWPGPILTDSGGFQVMSLGKLRTLDADGVTFRSHLDGAKHRLTPEGATETQYLLDATITMVLDECTKFPATHAEASASMELSMRWAARACGAFRARDGYALFGIVQGGVFPDLRARSAACLVDTGFDGYAIGGLAVGEGQNSMFDVLDNTVPRLPADKPRYLMGVGTPDDLLGSVARGVDMFDCVMPTRAGRTARAYTSHGVLNLRNARHADDPAPLDAACACPACTRHSRAYLHHLFRASEMLGPMLLTWHNVEYYQSLMRGMRAAIVAARFSEYAGEVRAGWCKNERKEVFLF